METEIKSFFDRHADKWDTFSFTYLKPAGGLYIVHSMTRAELDRHHRKAGAEVSDHILACNHEFKRLYMKAGFKSIEISDSNLFYSRGIKPVFSVMSPISIKYGK